MSLWIQFFDTICLERAIKYWWNNKLQWYHFLPKLQRLICNKLWLYYNTEFSVIIGQWCISLVHSMAEIDYKYVGQIKVCCSPNSGVPV